MELFRHELLDGSHLVELIEKIAKLESFMSPEIIKILKELLSVTCLKDSFPVTESECNNVNLLMKEVMEKCFSTMSWAIEVLSDAQLPAASNLEKGFIDPKAYESAMELSHSFDDLWKILVCCRENLQDPGIFYATASQFMKQIVGTMKVLKFNEANMTSMEAISKLISSYLDNLEIEAAQCEEIIQICLNHLDMCQKPQSLNMFLNNFLEPFLKHSCPAKRMSLLEILWGKCLISFHHEKFFLKQVKPFPFMLLVFIINFIIEEDPDSFILFNNGKLLEVLQFGLVQKDPITRKQCQHIFKTCLVLKKTVNCETFDPLSELAAYNDWNDYFLCLEILEENQAHVVSPVIAKLDKFWLATTAHSSLMPWIFVLYKRLFDHDNRTVCVWGINHLLKIKPNGSSGCEAWLKFLPEYLLPALHDYQLFLQHCTSDKLSLQIRLSEFFSLVLCTLPSNVGGTLVELFLSSLFQEMNWEDVSLYHILASMTALPTFHALSLPKAKSIALASQACWSSQEPLLREASQANLVKIILSQIDKRELTVELLCEILGSISSDLLFLKNKSLWKCLVDLASKLESLPSLSASDKDGTTRLEALKILLTLEVAGEKSSNSHEQTISVLKEVAQPSGGSMLQNIEMLYEVLLIINQNQNCSEIQVETHLKIMETYSELFIGKDAQKVIHFVKANDMANTGVAQSWLGILQNLFTHFHSTDVSLASSIASKCLFLIMSEQKWLSKSELSAFKPSSKDKRDLYLLLFISKVIYPYLKDCEKVLVLEILDVLLLQNISDWLEAQEPFSVPESQHNDEERKPNELINGISKKEWRLHNENSSSCVWNCLATLCEQANQCPAAASVASLSSCGARCLQVVLQSLPRVGRTSVASLYSLAETLTSTHLNHEEWQSLVSALLSHVTEFGNSADLLNSALTLLLQQERVSKQSMPVLIQVCCELLTKAQATRGIAPLLARRFAVFVISAQHSMTNYDWPTLYKSVLVPLLLFGPIPDKKLKALRGAALDIFYQQRDRGTGGELVRSGAVLWSPYHEAQETRCYATLVLLSLDSARAEDRAAAAHIVKMLHERFSSANDGRGARDFSNSFPHRVKTRALQAVLVLLPLLGASECGDVLQWVCRSTVSEQQQPSVRYLMEWMMALCVITWPELCPQFLELCRAGVKQRPGSVASFLAAVSLLACHIQDEAIVELCMTFALPWCMAQQYNSRLYAQLAMSSMYQHCAKHQFTTTLNKFAALKDCLTASQVGSSTDDFFFSIFDPVGHYSVQTIYYELPRLSLLSEDEWLSCAELTSVAASQKISLKTTLLLSSPADHLLRATSAAAWVTKAAKVGGGEALLPEEGGSSGGEGGAPAAAASKGGNMQRKVIPWSSLSKQQQHEALSSAAMRADGNTRRYPLTVVGSLLTKATNLGGLCRTCEVLGAGQLVLPSMALLHDQAFLGLSLASHKWIPLVEVNAEGVKAYLRDQRRAGYCIVAVEQTAHSVSLSSFQFPARSLLLLGNEREGLPCSLLREVDVCVEIPQFGVTRSLNAHVAGSLCVWQYVNQQSSADAAPDS